LTSNFKLLAVVNVIFVIRGDVFLCVTKISVIKTDRTDDVDDEKQAYYRPNEKFGWWNILWQISLRIFRFISA